MVTAPPLARLLCLLGIALPALAQVACRPSDGRRGPEPVVVFAAASTAEVVSELARRFELASGTEVRCSFAASSTLARQIEAGARADIFLSADQEWMDELQERGLIEPGSRSDLLGNRLVLIAPAGRGFDVELRPGFDIAAALPGRLALGDPEHVPAGRYAWNALTKLGWVDPLRSRLLPTVDVRAALRLVELGEAAGGIVYETDAAASDRVEVIARFDELGIRYPLAACRGAAPAARLLLEYFRRPESEALFAQSGFAVLR